MTTFYWYDYETFGNRPTVDWPVQFAGIRTDSEFNEIDEPLELLCRFPEDKLPQIDACLIHHFTPKQVQSELIEPEFIHKINQQFSRPDTCVVGYNNFNFDDEVTRFSLYRNFLDPYAREWQNRNSRWDLIDVVRLCYALRPEGLNWPLSETQTVSFKLENLTRLNNLPHDSAHNAVSDVRATIALAKLIQSQNPELMRYVLNCKDKKSAEKLLDLKDKKPVIYISSYISAKKYCLSVIMPIMYHPVFSNQIIVCDLSVNPCSWLNYSLKELKESWFEKSDILEQKGLKRLPLSSVRLNRCPVLVSWKVLRPQDMQRLEIDQKVLEQHYTHIINHHDEISSKLSQLFQVDKMPEKKDPDQMLYDGFFSKKDQQLIGQVSKLKPEQLTHYTCLFSDNRLAPLFFLYHARNWPDTLSETDRLNWNQYCYHKLCVTEHQKKTSPLEKFKQDILDRMKKNDNIQQQTTLTQLLCYIERKIETLTSKVE